MPHSSLARTAVTLNMGWAEENPALFVAAVADFYNTRQSPEWTVMCTPVMVPVGRTLIGGKPEDRPMKIGYLELVAVRSNKEPK